MQKRIVRKLACIACAKVEIVIGGLAPELDVVAAGTSPVAEQRVFGFCFCACVFGDVIDIVAFASIRNPNGHFFADLVDVPIFVAPLSTARNPVSVNRCVMLVNG